MTRKPSIDWLRGFAVLLMILWHAMDSWTASGGRDGAAFAVVAFLGGWAAPLFVFLAGVSIPLAGASRLRRGASREAASWSIQKRGWEILLLAHVFRFQSFLFNPSGAWSDLLKPDILNVLGIAIAGAAYAWGRATSPRAEQWWFIAPVVVSVAVVTPWAPAWSWPSLLPPHFEAYVRPAGDAGVFSLFPWVAYVFLGAWLGARLARHDDQDARFRGQLAAAGGAALGIGLLQYVPGPASTNAWLNEPLLFLFRSGAMTLALAVLWALFRRRAPARSSAMLVFGRTSLFVYWIHVELAYGVFSYPLHGALTFGWALAACALFTAALLGLAHLWERRPAAPLIPAHMRGTGLFSTD